MDPNLVIDDDYVVSVGSDGNTMGLLLQGILDQYIYTLNTMKLYALVKGDVADALSAYIGCAELLNNKLLTLSETLHTLCGGFLTDLDSVETYQF